MQGGLQQDRSSNFGDYQVGDLSRSLSSLFQEIAGTTAESRFMAKLREETLNSVDAGVHFGIKKEVWFDDLLHLFRGKVIFLDVFHSSSEALVATSRSLIGPFLRKDLRRWEIQECWIDVVRNMLVCGLLSVPFRALGHQHHTISTPIVGEQMLRSRDINHDTVL